MSAENSSRKKNILLLSLFFIAVAAGAEPGGSRCYGAVKPQMMPMSRGMWSL